PVALCDELGCADLSRKIARPAVWIVVDGGDSGRIGAIRLTRNRDSIVRPADRAVIQPDSPRMDALVGSLDGQPVSGGQGHYSHATVAGIVRRVTVRPACIP